MEVDVEVRPRPGAGHAGLRAPDELTRLRSNNESIWLTAGVALGCLTLAAVFLAGRGAGAERWPSLVGAFITSLVGSPVARLGAASESAAGALAAALIVAAWYGLGGVARRLIARAFSDVEVDGREPRALAAAEQIAFGAGAWSLVWFAFGVVRWQRTPVAVGALLTGLTLAVAPRLRNRKLKAGRIEESSARVDGVPEGRWLTRAAWLLMALPTLLAFVAALAPPTGKDALVYRLALPQAYAAAGGFVDAPHNVYSFLALGAEMNGVWALVVGRLVSARAGEAAFGALAFAYLPLLLMTTYGWAREWRVGRAWSLIAAAMVAGIPSLYQVASSGYADHALALYVALGVRAAGRWWADGRGAWLAAMAVALGCALAVKLIAVFACLPLLVVILLKAREAQAKSSERANAVLLSGMIALVGAGVLASPWYVRTWAKTGSPVFPFYVNVLGGSAPGWDAERSQMFQVFLARYGGEAKSLVDYLATPVRLSLQAEAEIASRYDGVLGVAFLVGLPLLVWAARRKRLAAEAGVTAAVAGSFYLCWLFSSQQLRFLLPVFACLAVATVAAARSLVGEKRAIILQWVMAASAVPGVLVSAAWFCEQQPVRAALGGEAREAYLARRLEHYPYYEIINRELPADARVWLVNMRCDTVHLQRAFVSDYVFEDYTLTQMVRAARDAGQLRERVRAAGVTHILIRHDVLLDYARSPIVDERRAEEENRFRLGLLKSLLAEEARVIRSDARYALVELKK
jgi:hypothetical protein